MARELGKKVPTRFIVMWINHDWSIGSTVFNSRGAAEAARDDFIRSHSRGVVEIIEDDAEPITF